MVRPPVSDHAFYERDGDRFVPTPLVENPWIGDAQSGVALAGLVMHVIGGVADPAPMLTARIMIDILGVVPRAPLTATTRMVRDGARLRLIETELTVAGRPCVRASALRVRTNPSPAVPEPPSPPVPGDDGGGDWVDRGWFQSVRLAGSFNTPGPGARWMRVSGGIVAAEPLHPLSAVAIAADFGTGTAPAVSPRDWTFANVDIGIYLARPPRGAWLLLDAETTSAGNGVGITNSRIGDADGLFATAHQTSFMQRR